MEHMEVESCLQLWNEGIASFSFGVGSRMHHVQPLTDDEAWDFFP